MAVKIQEGKIIDWENTTGVEVANKSVVDLGTRIGVAQTVIAIGETGAVELVGVYEETASTADEINVGDALYWNGTSLTTTSTDNTPAGMATSAKAAATAGSVYVRIG